MFQLVGLPHATVLPTIAPIILRSATPIAFGALCGVMCERSGVVNIGIEGTMLTAAFAGWIVGVAAGSHRSGRPRRGRLRDHAGAAHRRWSRRSCRRMAISLLHAWLSISLRADQIISGTIINIAAFGLTGYLNT